MPFKAKVRSVLRNDEKDMIIIGYVRFLIDRGWIKKTLAVSNHVTMAQNTGLKYKLFIMVIHIYQYGVRHFFVVFG
jgi:hypothetical protein